MNKEITVEDIIVWLTINSDDKALLRKINKITYALMYSKETEDK